LIFKVISAAENSNKFPKKNQVLEGKISWESVHTWANGTGHALGLPKTLVVIVLLELHPPITVPRLVLKDPPPWKDDASPYTKITTINK
jgi:hypothetical protein